MDGPQFPAKLKAGATAARDYLNVLKYSMKLDWMLFSPAIEMHQGISTAVRSLPPEYRQRSV